MAKLTGLTRGLSKGKTLTAKQKAAALAKAKAKAKSKVEKSLSKGPLVSTLSKKSQEADRPKRLDFYRKLWEAEDTIKQLAKKAGLTIKAFRRKNPNNKWVKQLHSVNPNIKAKDINRTQQLRANRKKK